MGYWSKRLYIGALDTAFRIGSTQKHKGVGSVNLSASSVRVLSRLPLLLWETVTLVEVTLFAYRRSLVLQ